MKKLFLITAATVMALAQTAFAGEFDLEINGKIVDSADSFIENDVIMVPLRTVCDELGYEVTWSEEGYARITIPEGVDLPYMSNIFMEHSLGADVIASKAGEANLKIEPGSDSYIMSTSGNVLTSTLSVANTSMMTSESMDKAAVIINSRIYVPVTLFYKVGAKVEFNELHGVCKIKTTGIVTEESTESAENTVDFSIENIGYSVKDKNEEVELTRLDLSYAVISEKENGAKKINNVLHSDASKIGTEFDTDYTQSQSEYYEEAKTNEEMNFHTAKLTSEVSVYKNYGCISVTTEYIYDLGGAHPTSIKISHVFDENGDEVTAEKVMGISEGKLKESVLKGWKTQIENNSDYYFEDAYDTLVKDYASMQYYIDERGLVFYMPLYDIAPYVSGYPELVIEGVKE